MHCLRDASSLQQFLNENSSPELSQLIKVHLDALAVFDDVPLGDLAHIFVLDQEDSVDALNIFLGRCLEDIPIETCISHAEWFELVVVVSDDGFGYIVFIPKTIKDKTLLAFCVSQARRTQEDMT